MRTMKIVGLCLWLAVSLACKKDEGDSACVQLQGIWQCESWIEDGEEFFGDTVFITGAEINFKPMTGNQGEFDWNIDYLIGGSEMIIGVYVVNESCDEVIITPKGGAPSTYSFSVSGNMLTLASMANGVEIEMAFQKD